MAKELNSAQKALRMYRLLFSDPNKHFLSDLAIELNCSSQTILRLAEHIENEYPNCFKTGIENGHRWYALAAERQNPLGLKYQELHYLSLCRDLAKPYISEEITQRVDALIFQLSTTLLEADANRLVNSKHPVTFFHKGMIDYSNHDLIIRNLLNCLEQGYFCHITYQANDSKTKKSYYFAPKRLIAMNQALYVYGAIINNCGNKIENLICLAVHRIHKLDLIKQKTTVEIEPLNEQVFGLPWHEPKTVKIRFKKEVANYIQERIWSLNQSIEELDNGDITLTIETTSIKETEAWVRNFGGKGFVNE